MKISITFESKPFKEVHGKDVDYTVQHNPCKYCALKSGFACISKKNCQWHKEQIFVKSITADACQEEI